MNNYLQQIALRSGSVEGSNNSTTLQMTPHASSFGEERLMERGSHEQWGEIFEGGERDQDTFPVHNKASAAHEQSLKPLATNEAISTSYLKAQVQRGPSTSNLYIDKPNSLPAQTVMAPMRESSALERQPLQKEHVTQELVQKISIADKERGEQAANLKQHMQLPTGTPFNKAIRDQSVIQPNATVPMPATPTKRKVENKLVIGKINVEVVKPSVQTKERVVVRTYQTAQATGHQDRNKLSFGLGQL